MTTQPDLFTNVHKGIRRALFEACITLGGAGDDPARDRAARSRLREVLTFVTHHGANEDELLVPILERLVPPVAARIAVAHAAIEHELRALQADLDHAPGDELYHAACAFTAHYLDHMREEECELEPVIRAGVPADDLAGFGRRAVERTSPTDQRTMLGWMLPAMTRADVEDFLARLPPELADELRPIARL